MKKILVSLFALSLSAIAYAGTGCGGGCGDKEKTTAEKPADKPADKPAAPKV